MRRTSFASISLAALALVSACADSHGTPLLDAAVAPDPEPCDACRPGRTCVRDVCVDDCGGDPSVFADALAPDLRIIGNVCFASEGGIIAARSRDADGFTLFHVHTATDGVRTAITLDRYLTSAATGAISAEGAPCSTELLAEPGSTVRLEPGLGLSPAGAHPHFGVNVSAPDGRPSDGRAYVFADGCSISERVVRRYGGSTMISEDPRDVIIHALFEDGMGLQRGDTMLAYGVGVASVQRYGIDHVIAPTGTGHGAVWMSFWGSASLAAGPFPVSGTRSEFQLWPRNFVTAEGRGVIGTTLFEEDFHVYPVSTDDPTMFPEPEPSFLASSAVFTEVAPVDGGRRILLRHERGLLIVE